jgi:hypothetical protein
VTEDNLAEVSSLIEDVGNISIMGPPGLAHKYMGILAVSYP